VVDCLPCGGDRCPSFGDTNTFLLHVGFLWVSKIQNLSEW
jgi:hypothetical protein